MLKDIAKNSFVNNAFNMTLKGSPVQGDYDYFSSFLPAPLFCMNL